MKKIYIRAKRSIYRSANPRDLSGFSMLEAVVVVGVLLAIAVGGFFAYGPIAKNAKIAKVKSVVSEVYTAVMVAQIDGDTTTSATSVIDTYNASEDKIKVEIRQSVMQPAVSAMSTTDYEPKTDNDFCVKASMLDDVNIFAEMGSCSSAVVTPPAPPPAPYVDPTPTKTILGYKCDVTTAGRLPISTGIKGTETWSDGVTVNQTGQSYPIGRTLSAGVDYTVVFDGTYQRFNAEPTWDKCLRSVDHWGSATGVSNAIGAFSGSINLTKIPAHIPTTITSMSNMFKNDSNLNDPNISQWDVTNVTDMNTMFYGATKFNQSLKDWNTANVTNLTSMFEGASSFNQPLNTWNVSKVTSIAEMFRNASSFNQSLASWNTSNVTDMHMVLFGTPYQQDLSSWNMDKVTRMAFMLSNPDTFSGNLQKTTHPTMTKMRFRCDVTTTGSIPLSTGVKGTETWSDGATNVNGGNPYGPTRTLQAGIDYTGIFEGTYYYLQTASTRFDKCLRSVDYWGGATTARGGTSAFAGAVNLTNVPDNIPSTITSTANMFKDDTAFNDPDVSKWNVSNVTDMSSMFSGATQFNQPLNDWNTANVTNLTSMFEKATSFNQPLNNWNTTNITASATMFRNASSFNQPLNNWNTTNNTDMHMMFFGAPYQQDLSSWNMNKVTRMAFMFSNPDTFNGNVQKTTHPKMTKMRFKCDVTTTGSIPLSTGVTGTETWSDGATNVNGGNPYGPTRTLQAGVEYTGIFEGTYYYLQTASTRFDKCLRSVDYWGSATTARGGNSAFAGAINLTNVPDSIPSTITSTANMFKGDTAFNDPDVSKWNVSNVTDMSSMFYGASTFNQNLSTWDVIKVTARTDFSTGSALTSGNLPQFK